MSCDVPYWRPPRPQSVWSFSWRLMVSKPVSGPELGATSPFANTYLAFVLQSISNEWLAPNSTVEMMRHRAVVKHS